MNQRSTAPKHGREILSSETRPFPAFGRKGAFMAIDEAKKALVTSKQGFQAI